MPDQAQARTQAQTQAAACECEGRDFPDSAAGLSEPLEAM